MVIVSTRLCVKSSQVDLRIHRGLKPGTSNPNASAAIRRAHNRLPRTAQAGQMAFDMVKYYVYATIAMYGFFSVGMISDAKLFYGADSPMCCE